MSLHWQAMVVTVLRPNLRDQLSMHDRRAGRAITAKPRPFILIGICTRLRNAQLRRLIDSILAQPIPISHRVEILVIDNNDIPVANEALAGVSDRFAINVVHEGQAGLVFARNRALDEATVRGADWFIGVDDDEWVAPNWLNAFVNGTEKVGEWSILVGPCRYVYDENLSRFRKPMQLPPLPTGARPAIMATWNFAVQRSVFDYALGLGLRFDDAFNESGGEDLEFFLRAEKGFGVTLSWLPEAVVSENCKGARATLRYRLPRVLRNQLSVFRVAQMHRRLGYYGSRTGNSIRLLLSLNRNIVFACCGLIAGTLFVMWNSSKGLHMIGRALERAARVGAIAAFVLRRTPIAYGAQVRPN